ncbi:MAG: hypothetical protein IJZ05_05170 [Rikenellaceae bacterium]|nr:hypothetical protein [Rikenellaceae bacterium]
MKTRLFRTVVAFFFAGMALTWVGCSDYDQDIADLNSRIDELTTGKIASIESQYSSLQSTLNSLQSADAAMTSKIAALEASAKQDVADLKGEQAAIQQALADMEAAQKTLKETIAAVEAQLDGFLTKSDLDATLASYATTEALAEVAAALDGVEDAVVAKAIEEATKAAVEAAGKALEESFQAKFDAALASAGLVTEDALKAKIDEAAAAMDQKIADAIAKAMENNGEVSVDIAKELAAAVEQIAQYLHGRLTSLLIVPDLYEDGIETVEFKTLAYTEWTKSGKEAYTQKGNKTFTTSYLTQKVNYTVGPKVVATEDIEKPVFVFNEAETRAATPALEVVDYAIKGGVLTVDVVKRAAMATVNNVEPMIWIGALEAPIAAAHLMEGEEGAVVRSDWAKFKEYSVVPYIASLIDCNEAKPIAKFTCTANGHDHFSATYEEAQEADPSQYANYNAELNLTEMVTGCYTEDGDAVEFTKAQMAKSGLALNFVAPTEPYTIGSNNTDQQKFIKVYERDGVWYAKAKVPSGAENNEASIDKQPIVRVELIDTNNNNAIVDVRYFKVEWTQVKAPNVEFGVIKSFNYTLCNCDFFGTISWEEFVTEVLSEYTDEGMSYGEFYTYYNLETTSMTIASDDHVVGDMDIVEDEGDVDNLVANYADYEFVHNFDTDMRSNTAMMWHLTTEQIGTVIDDLRADKEVKKTLDVVIKPKDEHFADYGPIYFSFEVVINLPELAVMSEEYMHTFWKDAGTVARIFPVQYDTNNTFTGEEHYGNGDGNTVVYNYPLHNLYNPNGVFVKGLLPCSLWNMFFAADVAADIIIKQLPENWFAPLKPDWNKCAPAETDENGNCNVSCTPSKDGAAEAWIVLDEGEDGVQDLLNSGAAYKIEFDGHLNPYNDYEIMNNSTRKGGFAVEFVKPLEIKIVGELEFTDQQTLGDTKNYHDLFSIVDCFGEKVDAFVDGLPAALAKYYEVSEYDVLWNEAVLVSGPDAGKKAEDVFSPEEANEWYFEPNDGSDNITFYNWSGVVVEEGCRIKAPATVTHKWGAEKMDLYITINPSGL